MMFYRVINDDCLKGLKRVQDNSVQLVLTSPPYLNKLEYNTFKMTMTYESYLEWLNKVWKLCFKKLSWGGRIVINIGDTNSSEDTEQTRPLHADVISQLRKMGFKYRDTIIWVKPYTQNKFGWGSFASPSNPRIRRGHEYIVIASKGDFKANGQEKTITDEEFKSWTNGIWNISNSKRIANHPCPFPTEMVDRVLKLYSFKGDTILDPFGGIGQVAVGALSLGRNSISIEIDKKYCQTIRERINKVLGKKVAKVVKAAKIAKEEIQSFIVPNMIYSPTFTLPAFQFEQVSEA